MINVDIYGDPSTWGNTQYVPFAKTVNYGTTIQNAELTDGVNAGKTPVNALIENSICTSALGSESLYSNIIWEHNGELAHDNADYTPYFYANCYDSSGYIKTFGSVNINFPQYDAWKPFQPDTGNRQNKSLHSRIIGEYQPKKILYELVVGVCPSNDYWNMHMYTLGEYMANTTLQTNYPKIFYAGLRAYFDNSSTDTPNRELSPVVRLFGACINRELTPFELNYNIDYMVCRGSDNYNSNTHIPLYGQPRTYITKGVNYYNFCLAPESDISFDANDIHIMHDNTPEFIEYLIQQAACFGVFVRISNDSGLPTTTIPLDNNDIICGELVNGVGHGDYTRGAANRDNDIWEWQTNRDSNFDPYNPPDPTRYDTTTVFNTVNVFDTFIKYYALNDTQLQRLCTNIYTYINSIDTNVEDISKAITKTFYTNNPLDVIVSLKKYPFNIGAYMRGQGSLENIKLGHLDSGTQGYKVSGTYTVIDLGSYPCYEYFGGTFLDYMPYTYYDLIVPFCGSIRLDPAQFMGHTLRLKMAIDIYTGACTCYILSDNLCIDTISGNCAIDIPVSGIQSADFQNSMQNAITNVKNARLDSAAFNMRGNLVIGSALTGEIGGGALMKSKPFTAAGNALSSMFGTSLWSAVNIPSSLASSEKEEARNSINVNKAEYDLQHLETPFAMVGSQSAANSFTEETNARLIIYRPQFASDYDPSIYADCFGFATLENDTLNKYSGFTVAKINLNGVRCSDEERTIIESMFAQGVYL